MLDVALVNYIGAGWCSLSPAYGLDVPEGGLTNGKILLQQMHAADPDKTQTFVTEAVETIWSDWLGSGMPNSVAVSHLEQLPKLIAEHQPSVDTTVSAIAISRATNKLGPAAIHAQARRLSSDVIERAREVDYFQLNGISDGVSFYFLEAIYGRLLRSWPIVDCANEQLRHYCETMPWRFLDTDTITAYSASEPEMAESQTSENLPVPADDPIYNVNEDVVEPISKIEPTTADTPDTQSQEPSPTDWIHKTVQAAFAKRGISIEVNGLQTSFFGRTYEKLIDILRENALPTDEFAAFSRTAEQLVTDGDFAQADLALSSLEQCMEDTKADYSVPIENLDLWLARCRSWRGKLHELQFDFRRAARHYEVATKYLARENYADRWTYVERQVQALAQQSIFFDDTSALDEAVKICSGFIVILHDTQRSDCQARAKVALARLLLLAGEARGQPSDLELAVRHLREAAEYFGQDQKQTELSDVKILQADVLSELGRIHSDPGPLETAVREYQFILGSRTAIGGHTSTVALSQKLGVALARLGQTTSNSDLLTLSIETLRQALLASGSDETGDYASNFLPRAYASLGDALSATADHADNKQLYVEAAHAYEKADQYRCWDPRYLPLEDIPKSLAEITKNAANNQPNASSSENASVEEAPGTDQPSTEATHQLNDENHYLAKLRQTLREAHFKQSGESGRKLSA